jgi:RNA polymerase sigma-70 factor (ECF subfamily)
MSLSGRSSGRFALGRFAQGRFATTRWSLVALAGTRSGPESRGALAWLCEAYWYPVYVYIRRRGHGAASAQDLTQEFFVRLLEKEFVRKADRARGKFRTFLLTAVQRFLSKQRERAGAKKRGGGRTILSLDFSSAERRYPLEPAHDWTPERLFERRWALTLLDRVLDELRQEHESRGKGEVFGRLKEYLTDAEETSYAQAAHDLQMSTGAVKVAVHRLRKRYRDLLRREVSSTVADESQADEELRELLAALCP